MDQTTLQSNLQNASFTNMSENTTDNATVSPAPQDTGLETSPSQWAYATDQAYRIGSPIIIVLGTAGNILAILVLRRVGTSSSTLPLFFTALAVSDLCLLYVGLFPVWVERQFGFSIANAHPLLCKVLFWGLYSFTWLSAWLLVAMTIQRSVSVVWPHKINSTCTHRQVYTTLAVLVVVIFGFNTHLLYGLDISEELGACFYTDTYVKQFLNAYLWVDLIMSSLLPASLLLLSNFLLIWKVLQSLRIARSQLAGGQVEQANARQKKFSSMTITLITVSFAFIILASPIGLLSLITFTNSQEGLVGLEQMLYFLGTLANLLWYTNGSINGFLYILTGTRFRQELKSMLGMVSKRRGGNQGDF